MSLPAFDELLVALAAEHACVIQALQDENAKLKSQLEIASARQVSPDSTSFHSAPATPARHSKPEVPYKAGLSFASESSSKHGPGIAPMPSYYQELDDNQDSSELFQTTKQRNWQDVAEGPVAEGLVAFLICLNTVIMAWEQQVKGLDVAYERGFPGSSPQASSLLVFFNVVDVIFTLIFSVELILRMVILRAKFVKPMNLIDIAAVTVGILDWLVTTNTILNPMMIRLVRLARLGKGLRIIRMSKVSDSLRLLLKCISASVSTLACSILLILVIQCVAGMLISQLVAGFIADSSRDFDLRLRLFHYYGTFTRSMLTMFEVTLANWSPPCRILVDNVSEWYSALFIIYRCLIGFACLNVINAVFIQQTMRVASQDKEIMIMQKERAQADNSRKMQEIFHTLDESGDGMISWEEFSKLLTDPVLKTWMSAMDLDIADVKGLWHLLDDGKGHIMVDDFIQGAARVKGPAKGFDMAQLLLNSKRLEDRIEALSVELSFNPLFNRELLKAPISQKKYEGNPSDLYVSI